MDPATSITLLDGDDTVSESTDWETTEEPRPVSRTTTTEEPTTKTSTSTTTITLTDTFTLESSSSSSSSSETSTDPTTPVTVTVYSPLPTETETDTSGSGGGSGGGGGGSLSSSAKAGIGVGVALGAIFVIAVGAIFWFRRWKRRTGEKEDDAPREPPVIAQTASVRAEPPFEMDPTERQVLELPGNKEKEGKRPGSESNLYELDT